MYLDKRKPDKRKPDKRKPDKRARQWRAYGPAEDARLWFGGGDAFAVRRRRRVYGPAGGPDGAGRCPQFLRKCYKIKN